MRPHLPGLDHLRALAICMVMLFHYRHFDHPPWIKDVGKFGFTGVDLFFVLSGYLIASGLFNDLDWRRFAVKRAFRILPAYVAVLALYFLWPTFQERSGISPLWRFLTFTQNFGLDLSQRGTFSHAWSLCVEEHFYAAMPLLLLTVNRRTLAWALPLLVLLGMLTRGLAWDNSDPVAWYRTVYYPTYQRLDGLIAGVSVAALMTYSPRGQRFVAERSALLGVLSIAVLWLGWWVSQDMRSQLASVVEFPLISLGYALLVASALSWRHKLAITELIAKLSFSTYLVHKGVYHLVQLGAEDSESSLTFCVCIFASFAVSAIVYLLIEKARAHRLLARGPTHHMSGCAETKAGVETIVTSISTAMIFWLTAAWTTVVSNADFTVERRPYGNDGLFEVRVTAHAKVTPEQMFKVVWGHGEYEEFVPHLKRLKILTDSGSEKLVYQQIKMPVVKDRDYTVRIRKTIDAKTQVYESDFETDNKAGMPEDQEHVRVAMIKGRWTLSPDDEGKGTDVVYQLYSDPGKELPLWIVNMAQKAAAPDLVRAMITRAEKRSSAK